MNTLKDMPLGRMASNISEASAEKKGLRYTFEGSLNSDTISRVYCEEDFISHANENLYIKTGSNDNVTYTSGDIIADIILNGKDANDRVKLLTEVSKELPLGYIRNILNGTSASRQTKLLRRKTISREAKKIIRILLENQVCMDIKKDEIERFIPKIK